MIVNYYFHMYFVLFFFKSHFTQNFILEWCYNSKWNYYVTLVFSITGMFIVYWLLIYFNISLEKYLINLIMNGYEVYI